MICDRTVEFKNLVREASLVTPASPKKPKPHEQERSRQQQLISPVIDDSKALLADLFEMERIIKLKHEAFKEQLSGSSRIGKAQVDDFQQFFDQMADTLGLCLKRIARLQESMEELSIEGAKKSSGSVFGWLISESSSKASQPSQLLAAIVWYLSHRYSGVSKSFENLKQEVEAREKEAKAREERRTALLASSGPKLKEPASASPQTKTALLDEKMGEEGFAAKYNLSANQMQLLRQENDAVLKDLSEMQREVQQTERSMNEIARLQTTLQESLLYQESTIERLYEDAEMTIEMVKKGNVLLDRAAKNQSSFRNVMVILILVLTFIILFMHYYSS